MSVRKYVKKILKSYKAAASAETPIDWGDGLWTLHAHEADVSIRVDEQIHKLTQEAPVKDCVVALSDKENYRKKLAPYYKANRSNVRKPMLLNYAKEYMHQHYNTIIYKGLEADDVLGILGTANTDTIIWSEDKDLLTIPAKHWIDGEVVEQTMEQADRMFYYQTLIGDTTDNYKGCPKVGAITANKLLDVDCSWDTVVTADSSSSSTICKTFSLATTKLRKQRRPRHVCGEGNLI